MNKMLTRIFLIFTIILTITLITLLFLGNIERKGYLKVQNVETHKYKIKMHYYDKIFRHSDLFSVHPITNNLPDYIETIKFDYPGSPFGNIKANKELKVDEKIDNVYYTIKLKKDLYVYLLAIYLSYLLTKFPSIFSKLDNNNKLFKIICIVILVFSLFIRVYYALQDEGYHIDEYISIWYSNQTDNPQWDSYSFNDTLEYNKKYSGKEIKQKYYYNDASIKDALNDIVSLYKNTTDPHISNVYYTFLRLAFIGREVSDITNIILTGTILNSLFYIISFFFLIKLLKLLFKNNNVIILFTLLCISLLPSSISFTMFLRPYQMQESFFIVFIYLVLNTILNKKYSKKNFIIITIITGIGYLILTSSIIFVLCVSLVIFFYYIYNNYDYLKSIKNYKNKIKLICKKTIEDKSLIYFASSFLSAFLVSFIIYPNFLGMFTNNYDRFSSKFIIPNTFLSYLNNYLFITPLYIAISFSFILIIRDILLNKHNISIKKYIPVLFIIIPSILFYIISNIVSPYEMPRYSIGVFPLLFIMVPTIFILSVNNKNIQYFLIIFISIFYIENSFTTKNIIHIYEKPSDDILIFNKKPNLDVYGINNLMSQRDTPYLNENQKYILIKDDNSLKNNILNNKISNFYLITRALNTSKTNKYLIPEIIKNELINNYNIVETVLYKAYTGNSYYIITELEKKE